MQRKGRLSLLIIQLDGILVLIRAWKFPAISSFACVSKAILVKLNEIFLENEVLKLKTWYHIVMFVSGKVSERLGKSTWCKNQWKYHGSQAWNFSVSAITFYVSRCVFVFHIDTRSSISARENIIKTTFIIYDSRLWCCQSAAVLLFCGEQEVFRRRNFSIDCAIKLWNRVLNIRSNLWWDQQKTFVGIKKLYWFIYYLLDHYAQTMSLLFFLLNPKDFYGICGAGKNKTIQSALDQ